MTLRVNNLYYEQGQKTLLADINAEINQAKLISIVGPNGAGKSTLLNCLSGLVHVGDMVQLNGKSIAHYSTAELAYNRAVLTQKTELNFPFTVKEVVAMGFAVFTLSTEKQEEIIHTCSQSQAVEHLENESFLPLSGGEKQRIHLARVMAQVMAQDKGPTLRYLMLDEPTAPLDLKHQFKLCQFLSTLPAQNIVVIMVIHDLDLAAAYSDEVWMMCQGRLVSQNQPNKAINQNQLKQYFDVDIEVIKTNNIHQLNKTSQL